MAPFEPSSNDLDGYRDYLRFLARTHLDDQVQRRVDPSDIVQETLLEAHRSLEHFRGQSEADLAGWLRRILPGGWPTPFAITRDSGATFAGNARWRRA